MKILFISDRFSRFSGGANSSAIDVLRSLLYNKVNVTVLSESNIKSCNKVLGYPGNLNWILSPFDSKMLIRNMRLKVREILKLFYYLISNIFRRGINEIKLNNYDLILLNSQGDYRIIEYFNNIHLCNKVAMIIRGSIHSNQSYRFEDTIKNMAKCNYLVYVSIKAKEEWERINQINEVKSFYIPNYIDEELINALMKTPQITIRKKLKIGTDKFIICCLGNVRQLKGQDLILAYMEDIIKISKDIIFFLVGDDSTRFAKELKNLSKENKFNRNIVFTGKKKNALEFLYASDLAFFPTKAEAMSRAILEAMALGKAIITSDVGGNTELITHKKEGLVFKHENSFLVTEFIEQMYKHPILRIQYGKSAFNKYWGEFSFLNQTQRYKKFIEEVKG